MTTPIKTQCPHCHACFNLQKTQLNQANIAVRCDHCQQYFLANKHLIVTTDKVTTDKSAINTDIPITIVNSSKPSELASDALINDDMDREETKETSVEYDLLKGIDAWLAQISSTNKPHPLSSEQPKNSAKTLNKNTNLTADSLLIAQLNHKADHKTPEKTAIRSAAANDIHASINNTADHTWLEELLKEQSDKENGAQADIDLAQLLMNIGAPVNDEDHVNQARTSTIQARMQSTQLQTRTSVAVLLWAMGCLVLVLLLLAQYVIFNLDTLIKNSVYAERLQTVCSIAACSLPSADLTTMTITDLSHRTSQISTTSAFSDVQATLNNKSAQAQLLPSLKVSVYGPNALIGEFIAMPDDYLLSPQNQLIAEGRKPFMFTIPVANDRISDVTFTPIY